MSDNETNKKKSIFGAPISLNAKHSMITDGKASPFGSLFLYKKNTEEKSPVSLSKHYSFRKNSQ